MKKSTVYLLIG